MGVAPNERARVSHVVFGSMYLLVPFWYMSSQTGHATSQVGAARPGLRGSPFGMFWGGVDELTT